MGADNSRKCLNVSPIRTVARAFLPSVLDDLGLNAQDFLQSAGLEAAFFGRPEASIEYPQLANLLQQAAELADCEHLGILLGQTGGMASLGSLGLEVSRAASVRAALSEIDAEFRSQDRSAIVELKSGAAACLSYIIVDPSIDTGAVISDAAMAIAVRILAELCGPGWAPELVELSRRVPRDTRPYRRLFKCPIAFNTTVAAIHFKGTWLDRPLAARRAPACAATELLPREFGAPDMTERVISLLARNIATGATISASKIARLFGVCGRTLQRELTKAQTSYRSLSDDVRFGAAKRLLQDTDMPVTEIALALGYADVSVLTRAFTRWAGTCPSDWRASNRPHFSRRAASNGLSILGLARGRSSRLQPLRV